MYLKEVTKNGYYNKRRKGIKRVNAIAKTRLNKKERELGKLRSKVEKAKAEKKYRDEKKKLTDMERKLSGKKKGFKKVCRWIKK